MNLENIITIAVVVVGWLARQALRDRSAKTRTTVARIAYLAADAVELAATHGLLGDKADIAVAWEKTFRSMLAEAGIEPTDAIVREAKPAALEHFTGRARAQSPGTPHAKKTMEAVRSLSATFDDWQRMGG